MSTRISSDRLLRSLTILVLPFALLAALLPATSPPASAGESTLIRSNFQVYLCPTDYDGSDYLIDCDNGGAGEFSITAQDADPVNPTATESTDEGGFIALGTVPGPVTFSLEVPGDFARFYLACFNGDGVFQFDGTTNVIDVTLVDGDALNCRWYVIPEDAGAPSPSPAPSQPETNPAVEAIDVQVYVCPVAYAGDEYLTDCAPTKDPIAVLLSPAFPFDPNDFITVQTATDGRVGFEDLAADDYSVAVDVPGDFADFYHACFDVTSGSEDFLSSGFTNTADFPFADQTFTSVSCRFYVIPEDLSGESASPTASASVAPSVAPTASPRSSAGGGAVNVLPSTGTGSGAGSPSISLLLAGLAILAVASVAVAARRMSSAGR